jgi:hypothetical protein
MDGGVKMKIIKEGDIEHLKLTKRFLCRGCGCVFDADKWEYSSYSSYNEVYFVCPCPTCGRKSLETNVWETD